MSPYGVADYVQRFAAEKDSLRETIREKDRVFRLLFGREPKYFDRTLDGDAWYETNDKSNLSLVISESECLFGLHPIYDIQTILALAGLAIDILGIVFSTSFFATGIIKKSIGNICKAFVKGLCVGEAIVKLELSSFTANSIVEKSFDNTSVSWTTDLISIASDLNDIIDVIIDSPNYYSDIFNYCADNVDYSIYLELKNNHRVRIDDVCDAIN